MHLTRTRIHAGVYEGVLQGTGPDAPEITAMYGGGDLADVTLSSNDDNTWSVRINLPADLMSEGVQTIVISDKDTDQTLDSFTIAMGEPVAGDLTAEIALLRAELDIVKRAFQRHCRETT
ncbi:hypothetical protein [Litoreibacter roseus]|uniref:Uncharacterized protein n=1 Tax=Litoreibacter roseus TaxID=2601869 RepID=A0A6N6JGR8_9RHOB|nr:hypothetical protein [Litoreibacter roseus]GFE64488.1 hypothetical protein KIN_15620 [Litoreibacter roseus]